MFVSRSYQAVPQHGDSDMDTDNETAFFSTDSRKWRIGIKPDDLTQDPELDLPYIHPTIPVETKKINYNKYYTRRQLVSGCCLMFIIVAMVTAFAVAIVLGEKYIIETPPTYIIAPPTNSKFQSATYFPTPTPLVNFVPNDGLRPHESSQRNTNVTMTTTSPIPIPNSLSTIISSYTTKTNEVTMVTTTKPDRPVTSIDPSSTHKVITEMNRIHTSNLSLNGETIPSHILPKLHRPRHEIFWERNFFPRKSASSIELYDMNRDGMMDVIVTVDQSPCASKIIALDGQLGTEFWQKEVNFPAFAIRCELDVNGDGVSDCLVTGRGGGFVAIDQQDGSLLWSVDPSIVFPPYNFYFPLIVSDLDNDGIDDLINMHGGDGSYHPEEHDRSPAYLVVISGKTGQSLMPPMLTPDGHESYMSPVLFKLNGKDDMILFGSGGETVSGSLWAVSLISLKHIVSKYQFSKLKDYKQFVNDSYHPCFMKDTDFNEMRPTFDKEAYDFKRPIFLSPPESNMRFCPRWADVNPIWNMYSVCVYELVKTEVKGVMVPPVLVDLDLDGIDDVIVTSFDGHTIVLSGSDASTRLWEVYYPNTESYSVPAPLYYNQDSIPDLMVRSNYGEWKKYTVSSVKVLDGRNGEELWSFDSTHSSMSSGLSIAADIPGFDAMLFFGVGKTDSNTDQSHSDSNRSRRHGSPSTLEDQHKNKGSVKLDRTYNYVDLLHFYHDPSQLWVSTPEDPFPDPHTDFKGFVAYCGETVGQLTASIWLVTREMVESGEEIQPIATHKPFLFNKNRGGISGHSARSKRHGETASPLRPTNKLEFYKNQRCAHVAKPLEIVGTPAIGDFNLDGHLDISYCVVWSLATFTAPTFKVFSFTLEDKFNQNKEVKGQSLVNFDLFLTADKQPWNRYMGHHGNNTYTKNSN